MFGASDIVREEVRSKSQCEVCVISGKDGN